MPVKHKRPPLSEEERAERRRGDREYARAAVGRLRSSEGWQQWLVSRRHFHTSSLGNQLLIAMARPTATRVAGFRAWLQLGYAVRKRPGDVLDGQWAIRIWAPCPPSRKQVERWERRGADPDERPRTYFKLVPVFDTLSRVRVEPAILDRLRLDAWTVNVAQPGPLRVHPRSSRSRSPLGDGVAAIAGVAVRGVLSVVADKRFPVNAPARRRGLRRGSCRARRV